MVRLSTFPSGDIAFRHAVENLVASAPEVHPERLQALLRPLYPAATVTESAVSGGTVTYYAYRDGRFEPSSTEEWWNAPGTAEARLSATTGVLLGMSDEWADLMGAPAAQFVGRHFLDLVSPEASAAATALFAAVLENSDIRSRILVRRADDEPLNVEFRAVRQGEEIVVFYRPA